MDEDMEMFNVFAEGSSSSSSTSRKEVSNRSVQKTEVIRSKSFLRKVNLISIYLWCQYCQIELSRYLLQYFADFSIFSILYDVFKNL